MSIEQDIRDLRDAIRDLIQALEKNHVRFAPAEDVTEEQVHFAASLEPRPIVRTIDYVQDIQKPALALVQAQGRDALAKILATFNVKTAKEIMPDQYEALADAIQEALS